MISFIKAVFLFFVMVALTSWAYNEGGNRITLTIMAAVFMLSWIVVQLHTIIKLIKNNGD